MTSEEKKLLQAKHRLEGMSTPTDFNLWNSSENSTKAVENLSNRFMRRHPLLLQDLHSLTHYSAFYQLHRFCKDLLHKAMLP